jgi:dihydrofolate reductase
MRSVIVIQYTTLDGVIEDPDGRGGTPFGGWAFRWGPEGIAGDKFRLGPIMQSGVLLFGRRTWEHFAGLWPARSGGFADAMNAAAKLVVTSGSPDLSAWQGSTRLAGDLLGGVEREKAERDVVVIGSTSVAQALAAGGLVDEYRLLVAPTVAGAGRRLLVEPADLDLAEVDRSGPMAYLRLARSTR